MTASDKLKRRLERILQSVSLQKPDRVPVVLEYAGFAASATQTPMSAFIGSRRAATQTMIQAYELVGGGDAINYGSFAPYDLCYIFGAKVKVPGFDLPDDELWQVLETDLMTAGDYDHILEMGWNDFFRKLLSDRILDDADENLLHSGTKPVEVVEEWKRVHMPVLSGGTITTPFELLCGARSLERFFLDLTDMPDKIEKVMEVIAPFLTEAPCRQALKGGFPAIWVGGWRGAPCMMSPDMWNRFVWPYFKQAVLAVLDTGLIPILHLDDNWDREMERFKELPAGKLVISLDGETDIFNAKKAVGEHHCIMGDVPPALLAFGTAADVTAYCSKLIRELGPQGFILQSGCDIPANAKLENVQAMVQAVSG